jgi:hypothetical protein
MSKLILVINRGGISIPDKTKVDWSEVVGYKVSGHYMASKSRGPATKAFIVYSVNGDHSSLKIDISDCDITTEVFQSLMSPAHK